MSELYSVSPEIVPKPLAWGMFHSQDPATYFFLSEFKNISDELPDPEEVGFHIANLHKKSISPTGKFGFHRPTFDGQLPQIVDWDSNWASFFSKLLSGISKLDAEVNGAWKDLDLILNKTIKYVIPRLLGALESDGRSIKPCLIHGDVSN